MTRYLLAVCAALGGCITTTGTNAGPIGAPPEKPESEKELERVVAAAFEEWKTVTMAGDVKKHLELMTAGFVSHWLWVRLQDRRDEKILKWIDMLPKDLRSEYDFWKRQNEIERPQRAHVLPDRLLGSTWIVKLYEDYFKEGLAAERLHLQAGKVAGVAVDSSGATVISSLGGERTEMFAMVPGPDGKWRIDGYIPPRVR